ncbi:MAG: hypothetical protein PVI28_10440 [Gammaproteobacteria bacterium]
MEIQATSSDLSRLSVVFIASLSCFAAPAGAEDGWQERMLFSPSAHQLELEQRGRVMIYDGMKDSQIRRAIDTQFDRIQSMMFVRTIATDAEGEVLRDDQGGDVVVEDDGC